MFKDIPTLRKAILNQVKTQEPLLNIIKLFAWKNEDKVLQRLLKEAEAACEIITAEIRFQEETKTEDRAALIEMALAVYRKFEEMTNLIDKKPN